MTMVEEQLSQRQLGQMVQTALQEAFRERGHLNILIAGRTGVGKSTLINAIFQGNLAETGQGRPVTQYTREISKPGIPLSIFDTRGLEMADYQRTLRQLQDLIRERRQRRDPREHLHCAWVCIAEDSRRVEPAEEQLVALLDREHIPVIVVITKARADQGFRAKVQELLPQAVNVVRVRAIREELDEGTVLSPMGLRELVELTMQVVPRGCQRALAAAQKVDLELKKNQSHGIVLAAASSAAALAATPLPFSDAVAIVPIQVGMLAGISATFGLPIEQGLLMTLVGSLVTGVGATLTGRAIVASLLKLIPGVGSVVGGAINATTAMALTTLCGEAYIAALELLFSQHQGEPPPAAEVALAFRRQLTQRQHGSG